MSHLCLTSSLLPAHYEMLKPELGFVDAHFFEADPQHEQRRWEYAMAIRAFRMADCDPDELVLDVGGAGSPLHPMLAHAVGAKGLWVVDPKVNTPLEDFADGPSFQEAGAVFCISTIEHVPEPTLPLFLDALAKVTAPGGLLFLTSDVWDQQGEDRAHFHWMRERIYTMETWEDLLAQFVLRGCELLGPADWTYYGDQLFGSYSFCSMALVKR